MWNVGNHLRMKLMYILIYTTLEKIMKYSYNNKLVLALRDVDAISSNAVDFNIFMYIAYVHSLC